MGVDAHPARRLLLQLGVGVLLVLLLHAFVIQSFHVSSGSMEPTIAAGDRVVVTKLGSGTVERGDVIVFDGTGTFAPAARTPFGRQNFLKRVAGVGGDTVSCTPDGGLVVDGDPVAEPWLPADEAACATPFEVAVPPGRLFVLGDHRSESADSRSRLGDPGGGMVPVEDVIGHVTWRYWPLDRAGGVGT